MKSEKRSLKNERLELVHSLVALVSDKEHYQLKTAPLQKSLADLFL